MSQSRKSYGKQRRLNHHPQLPPSYWTPPVAPMNGQVYFGDPYQYKQYLELRHAVNPFLGVPPPSPQPIPPAIQHTIDAGYVEYQYKSQQGMQGSYPNYLANTRPSTLALPSTLQPGVGVNPCLAANYNNAAPHMTVPVRSPCVDPTVHNTNPVPPPTLPKNTPVHLTLTTPTLSHTPTNTAPANNGPCSCSVMHLTPPTSNTTPQSAVESDTPELVIPEIGEAAEQQIELSLDNTADKHSSTGFFSDLPTTPPCELDELLNFAPTDLSDFDLDIFGEKPLNELETPENTPEKELPTKKFPEIVIGSPNLNLSHFDELKIERIDTACPQEMGEQIDILSNFCVQNNQTSTIYQTNCLQTTTPVMNYNELEKQLIVSDQPQSCVLLTSPLNKPNKCAKKTNKRGRKPLGKSSKKSKDDHLLQKVLADTFMGNADDQKNFDLFDESMFLNNSHVPSGITNHYVQQKEQHPALLHGRNTIGRDYQHLVNSHHQNWGSSDVRVQIISNSDSDAPSRNKQSQPTKKQEMESAFLGTTESEPPEFDPASLLFY